MAMEDSKPKAPVIVRREARNLGSPARRMLVTYWPDHAARRRAAATTGMYLDSPIRGSVGCHAESAVTFSKGTLRVSGPDTDLTIPFVSRVEVSTV
jgi:hypothetical protein